MPLHSKSVFRRNCQHFKPSPWFGLLRIVNADPVGHHQRGEMLREIKMQFSTEILTRETAIELFLALPRLTLTGKLPTSLNVGIAICHLALGAKQIFSFLGCWNWKSLIAVTTCVSWSWWRLVLVRGCGSLGHGRSRSEQLGPDWWPRLFNAAKGRLS